MKGRVNDKAHLELILKSIGNVFEFTANYDSYQQFENDKLCCHAVAYNVQCIGESVYKMSQDSKSPPVISTKRSAQRNLLQIIL